MMFNPLFIASNTEVKPQQCDKNYIIEIFSFVHVPSTNMEVVTCMTYTAASHQDAIKVCPHI